MVVQAQQIICQLIQGEAFQWTMESVMFRQHGQNLRAHPIPGVKLADGIHQLGFEIDHEKSVSHDLGPSLHTDVLCVSGRAEGAGIKPLHKHVDGFRFVFAQVDLVGSTLWKAAAQARPEVRTLRDQQVLMDPVRSLLCADIHDDDSRSGETGSGH
jgi:hypothetical protein